MTNAITGVDFVCVPTRDHERSAEFYGETLGLQRLQSWGQMPATEFQAGNLTLAVMEPTAFGSELRPHALPIAFHVDDVAAARTELEGKGIEFPEETFDTGVCHMAPFADPDGNALMLHHRYAPKDQGPS